MPLSEITELLPHVAGKDDFWGFHLDEPVMGASWGYELQVSGWVIGRRSPVVSVELADERTPLVSCPVKLVRPDVAAAYPHVADAERSGFSFSLTTLKLLPEFELVLRVVFDDGSRVTATRIRGRRARLNLTYQSTLQPLMITTLGRTGSTWLLHLLREHPAVVAYGPFKVEPRVATYWIEIFWTLAEPASFLRQLNPTGRLGPRWWLPDPASGTGPLQDPIILRWFNNEYIEELAVFCQSRIEAVYAQIGKSDNRIAPKYFAEKFFPNRIVQSFLKELYPAAREVILVRDFRDMVSSMLAYDAKRGFLGFGRERAESDKSYIDQLRHSVGSLLRGWQERRELLLLIRYEDLVREPRATLSVLLKYLGLDSDVPTIETMLSGASQTIPEMAHHRTSEDSTQSIGRWRNELDPELLEVCQHAFGPALEAFGYMND